MFMLHTYAHTFMHMNLNKIYANTYILCTLSLFYYSIKTVQMACILTGKRNSLHNCEVIKMLLLNKENLFLYKVKSQSFKAFHL